MQRTENERWREKCHPVSMHPQQSCTFAIFPISGHTCLGAVLHYKLHGGRTSEGMLTGTQEKRTTTPTFWLSTSGRCENNAWSMHAREVSVLHNSNSNSNIENDFTCPACAWMTSRESGLAGSAGMIWREGTKGVTQVKTGKLAQQQQQQQTQRPQQQQQRRSRRTYTCQRTSQEAGTCERWIYRTTYSKPPEVSVPAVKSRAIPAAGNQHLIQHPLQHRPAER